MTLNGKVAVVTGAGGTMGRAVVDALVAQGCRVAMVDVQAATMEPAIARHGAQVGVHVCDIRSLGEVRQAHQAIVQAWGPVDILVNNAGVLSNHKVEATTESEWRGVLAVNLDGALFWSQCVTPAMKARRWGRIINTGSLASKTGGLTAGTAYSVSKGAISALTFSLARELAAFGVTANAIAPAYVRTPMVTDQLSEIQRQALLQQIPVGRFCEPEEFAHVVTFLAAPLSGFITGEIIDLNGGLHMD
ncbi:SDR family NAD(P)-dependent oxidoreductase [Hylemonella gracilis]|uniref:SDR family NAD(P)-dependent oxidoreductase n=2 Tax=Hylemonella gracilis TaxID=80880 RepID=A0A4P6US07_9BURK|nr:SDR family NAD(P)-dependent oxidoreductase [Hylemonella gracilis]